MPRLPNIPSLLNISSIMRGAMNITWDPAKNRENQRKHGISFDDAKAVFQDPDRIEVLDDRLAKSDGKIRVERSTPRNSGIRLISHGRRTR